MSLRLNLSGWSLQSFKRAMESGDEALFEMAAAKFSKSYDERYRSKGLNWLRTLIHKGYSFREDHVFAIPDDGGLINVRMETEMHVFVVYSLIQAIATPEHLDLALHSSQYAHPAIGALHKELMECKFAGSKDCPREYWGWIYRFNHGSPLFGDDFRTDWSYYTIFSNDELAAIVQCLRAAEEFKRVLPEQMPQALTEKAMLELSADGKRFASELRGWFDQIQQAGQDAFILWW